MAESSAGELRGRTPASATSSSTAPTSAISLDAYTPLVTTLKRLGRTAAAKELMLRVGSKRIRREAVRGAGAESESAYLEQAAEAGVVEIIGSDPSTRTVKLAVIAELVASSLAPSAVSTSTSDEVEVRRGGSEIYRAHRPFTKARQGLLDRLAQRIRQTLSPRGAAYHVRANERF